MQLTDRWSRDCPAECRLHEGPDDDEWPLIIVHAPILGPAEGAAATYAKGLEARIDSKLQEVSMQRDEQDGFPIAMRLHEPRAKWEDPGEGEFSMVALISRGEVTLPIELKSLVKSGLQERASTFSSLLRAVTIDPARAMSGAQAAARTNADLAEAVAEGYAKGERAIIYTDVDAGIRNEFRVGGLQLIAYREENKLIFLPGGVFLEPGQEDFDLRNPDNADLTEEKVLGKWTRSGGSYVV